MATSKHARWSPLRAILTLLGLTLWGIGLGEARAQWFFEPVTGTHNGYVAAPGVVRYEGDQPSEKSSATPLWVIYQNDGRIDRALEDGGQCTTCTVVSGKDMCAIAKKREEVTDQLAAHAPPLPPPELRSYEQMCRDLPQCFDKKQVCDCREDDDRLTKPCQCVGEIKDPRCTNLEANPDFAWPFSICSCNVTPANQTYLTDADSQLPSFTAKCRAPSAYHYAAYSQTLKVVEQARCTGGVEPSSLLVDETNGQLLATAQDGIIAPFVSYFTPLGDTADKCGTWRGSDGQAIDVTAPFGTPPMQSCSESAGQQTCGIVTPRRAQQLAFESCPPGLLGRKNASGDGAILWAPLDATLEAVDGLGNFVNATAMNGYYSMTLNGWPLPGADSQEYTISASLRFAPFSTRTGSARTFTLGSAHGVIGTHGHTNFSLDATMVSGRLYMVSDEARVTTVTGGQTWAKDYWPEGETRYQSTDKKVELPGLVKEISQADLRDTSIYVFREADGKLIGSRWGLLNSELTCAPTEDDERDNNAPCDTRQHAGPDGTIPPNATYQIMVRGTNGKKTSTYIHSNKDDPKSGATGRPECAVPNPPSDCTFIELHQASLGLELAYAKKENVRPEDRALIAGEQLRIVALNHATGYLGSVRFAVSRATYGTQHVPNIVMRPPNLKVSATRRAKYGGGEYRIGSEGAGLTSDEEIVITTEWLDFDGKALPAELAITGRIATSVFEETEQPSTDDDEDDPIDPTRDGRLVPYGSAAGVVTYDDSDQYKLGAGQFPIRPGLRTVVYNVPKAELALSKHFYIHVDGADPNAFGLALGGAIGGAQAFGPDFATKQTCYWGLAPDGRDADPIEPCDGRDNNGNGVVDEECPKAKVTCVTRGDATGEEQDEESEKMLERPWTHVPVLVPTFDKKATEAALAAAIQRARQSARPGVRPVIEDINPVYNWGRSPEYHFSLLDLDVEDINLTTGYVDGLGSRTGVAGDYHIHTDGTDELTRLGSDRVLTWGIGRAAAQALLDEPGHLDKVPGGPYDGGLELDDAGKPIVGDGGIPLSLEDVVAGLASERSYEDEDLWNQLTPEDYAALSLWQNGDEANTLFEIKGLPLILAAAQPLVFVRHHHVAPTAVEALDDVRDDYRAIPFAIPEYDGKAVNSLLDDNGTVYVSVQVSFDKKNFVDVVPFTKLSPDIWYVVLDYERLRSALTSAVGFSLSKKEFVLQILAQNTDPEASAEEEDDRDKPLKLTQRVIYPSKLSDEFTGVGMGQNVVHDVLVQDGSLHLTRSDFALGGHGPVFAFTRSYSNTDADSDDNVLGPGWTHSYDHQLVPLEGQGRWQSHRVPQWVTEKAGAFVRPTQLEGVASDLGTPEPGTPTNWRAVMVNGTTFYRVPGTALWIPEKGRHAQLHEVNRSDDYPCATKRCYVFVSLDGTEYVYDVPTLRDGTPPITHISTLDSRVQHLELPKGGLRIGDAGADGGAEDAGASTVVAPPICHGEKPPRPSRFDPPAPTPLVSVRDRFGNKLKITRDTEETGRVETFEDESGRVCALHYVPRCEKLEKPEAGAKYRGYWRLDKLSCLEDESDDEGQPLAVNVEFEYDERGLLSKVTRGDLVERYDYEQEDPESTESGYNLKVVHSVAPGGDDEVETTYDYYQPGDALGGELDDEGWISSAQLDRKLKPTDVVKHIKLPDTQLASNEFDVGIEFIYDIGERLRTVRDGRGKATDYKLLVSGHAEEISEPRGKTTTFTWSHEGGDCGASAPSDMVPCSETVTTFGTATRKTEYLEYDSRGNATLIRRSGSDDDHPANDLGNESFTYNAFGDLLSHTDTYGQIETWTYDGPLLKGYTRAGKTWTYEGHELQLKGNKGLPRTVIPPAPRGTVTIGHDVWGNVETVREDADDEGNGGSNQTIHDARGRLRQQIDLAGRITRHYYDDLDHLEASEYPEVGHTAFGKSFPLETFNHDPLGNLTNHTDRNGQTLFYRYSPRGEVTAVERLRAPQGVPARERRFEFDAAGNLRTETDWGGYETEYKYDDLGLRTSIERADMVATEEHDLVGRLTSRTDFRPGDRLETAGVKTSFEYDFADRVRVERIKNQAASSAVEPEYVTIVDYARESSDGAVWSRTTKRARGDGTSHEVTEFFDASDQLVIRQEGNESTELTYFDSGELRTTTLKSGDVELQKTTYEIDSRGHLRRVIRVHDGLSRSTEYDHHDDNYEFVERVDNQEWTTRKDAWGRIVQRTDPNGYVTKTEYDGVGNVVAVVDAQQDVESWTRDELGLVLEHKVGSETTTFKYDGNGQIIRVTDPAGLVTVTADFTDQGWPRTITQQGQVSSPGMESAEPRSMTFAEYDGMGHPTRVLDYRGLTPQNIAYSAFYEPLEVCRGPFGGTQCEKRRYNAAGRVKQIDLPDGDSVRLAYDAQDRLSTVTHFELAGLPIEQFRYDAAGNLTAQQDLGGKWTSHVRHDADLLVTSTLRGDGPGTGAAVEKSQYDESGRLERRWDALALELNGEPTEVRTYYENGWLHTITQPPVAQATAAVATYDYYPNGLIHRRQLTGAADTVYDYHTGTRRLKSETFAGLTTRYDYTVHGDVREVRSPLVSTRGGRPRTLVYDAYRRLKRVEDEKNIRTEYAYDPNDNLEDVRVAVGLPGEAHTEIAYDALDRVETHTEHAGNDSYIRRCNLYDGAGRCRSLSDANNNQIGYEFDALGRPVLATYQAASTLSTGLAMAPPTRVDWAYEGLRLKSVTETRPNGNSSTSTEYNDPDVFYRPHTVHARGVDITLDYYRGGELKSVTAEDGTTAYEYNARGLLDTLSVNGAQSHYIYYTHGGLKEITRPNQVRTEVTYDTALRVDTLAHKKGSASLASYDYDYDPNGNPIREVLDVPGRLHAVLEADRPGDYDEINRLQHYRFTVDELGSVPPVRSVFDTKYTFEGYNRKTETVVRNDLLAVQRTYQYQGQRLKRVTDTGNDQPGITDFGYDNNGNLTSRTDGTTSNVYEYDARNTLVQVLRGAPGAEASVGQYGYDGEGQRIFERGDRGDVRSFWAGGQPILEKDPGNELVARHHLDNKGDLFAFETEGSTLYAQLDSRGSTSLLTGSDGSIATHYAVDPWGKIVSQAGTSTNRQVFTGHQHDTSTGLVYARARYYDPSLGAFLGQDPWEGEMGNPFSLQKYAYGYGNPLLYTDPDGRQSGRQFIKWLCTGEDTGACFDSFVLHHAYNALDFATSDALSDIDDTIEAEETGQLTVGQRDRRIGRSIFKAAAVGALNVATAFIGPAVGKLMSDKMVGWGARKFFADLAVNTIFGAGAGAANRAIEDLGQGKFSSAWEYAKAALWGSLSGVGESVVGKVLDKTVDWTANSKTVSNWLDDVNSSRVGRAIEDVQWQYKLAKTKQQVADGIAVEVQDGSRTLAVRPRPPALSEPDFARHAGDFGHSGGPRRLHMTNEFDDGGGGSGGGGFGGPPPAPRYRTKAMVRDYETEELVGNTVHSPPKVVRYFDDAERSAHRLSIDDGEVFDASDEMFDTGGGMAIWVMDDLGNFYASKSFENIHHSSFLAGRAVAAAGEMRVHRGRIMALTKQSGHYRHTNDFMEQALRELAKRGVNVRGLKSW